MFQINWKTKSLFYKIFGFLKLKIFFYIIQKLVTKRSKINIKCVNKNWEMHSNNINKFQVNSIVEFGAGKSLEQNIYFSYIFDNKIKQTVIDINKMIDFALFNEANLQISKISVNTIKCKEYWINSMNGNLTRYHVQLPIQK